MTVLGCHDEGVPRSFRTLSKLRPGDRVAVLSRSFAAPGFAPAVHEQALRRIRDELGLEPVEYPTTRMLGADPRARATDVEAALAASDVRAVFASIGGDDQITVVPHVDLAGALADPKPFVGYSDNTHLLNALWQAGVPGFYGGSTQVHIGAGPGLDGIHLQSLRAALFDGGELELTEPGESEDTGVDWLDPRALISYGDRVPTEPWTWSGPARVVEGRTWGGCLDVLDEIGLAGRMPELEDLRGGILLLETSEELPSPRLVARWVRALGEHGVLGVVAGVVVARPPVSSFGDEPDAETRRARREAQREVVTGLVARYNPDAVVCVGVPFGHTRPQWIVPYGGTMRLDGVERRVFASYD